MRLHCDAGDIRRYEKEQASKEWHPWFAWYPVRLSYNDCRWLEYVERRKYYSWGNGYWDYRELTIKV